MLEGELQTDMAWLLLSGGRWVNMARFSLMEQSADGGWRLYGDTVVILDDDDKDVLEAWFEAGELE